MLLLKGVISCISLFDFVIKNTTIRIIGYCSVIAEFGLKGCLISDFHCCLATAKGRPKGFPKNFKTIAAHAVSEETCGPEGGIWTAMSGGYLSSKN